jgi:alanyl-tRNA synthetase
MIILEEAGIAKGIRRIIAVTGQEAYQAQRNANEFSVQLERLEKMPLSVEKEKTLKQTKVELDRISISTITKTEFRTKFERIAKEILVAQVISASSSLPYADSIATLERGSKGHN